MRTVLTSLAVCALLGLVPAAAAQPSTWRNASHRAAGYPNSMVVIGNADVIGFASNPAHPFRDAPENSWASGTNPAVNSVYVRILSLNPAIKGQASNLGGDIADFAVYSSEVQRAIALKPDLVLVEIGGDEIKCDGKDATRYAQFRSEFQDRLTQLSTGLPNAQVFVVGEWGINQASVDAQLTLSVAKRLVHASKGPCSIFAPVSAPSPGSLVPAHVAYLFRTLRGYDAQRAAACAQVPRCHYDGGAAERVFLTPDDLTHRFDHLSIAGQAKLAAAEWAAMKRMHVIPG